jgi:hypothetical protein
MERSDKMYGYVLAVSEQGSNAVLEGC